MRLAAGESPHQRLEQAFVGPEPEPAANRAPGWKASRQPAPGGTRPQMPGDPRQHPARGRRIRTVRRIRSLKKAGHLVQTRLKHHVLQARLVTRPMSVRPHLLSTPPRQADFVFAHETDADDRRRPQTGSETDFTPCTLDTPRTPRAGHSPGAACVPRAAPRMTMRRDFRSPRRSACFQGARDLQTSQICSSKRKSFYDTAIKE